MDKRDHLRSGLFFVRSLTGKEVREMKQTVTVKIKLHEPTQAKRRMYQEMADRVTEFANNYLGLDKRDRPRTSKEAKEYSRPLPSAVLAQAIRDIKSKPKAKRFKRLWPNFNNQNFRVEKETSRNGGIVWKASFPTLEKRVGVPVTVTLYQEKYLEMLLSGRAKQGSALLVKRGEDWYIHLSLTITVKQSIRPEKVMGIDLGLIDLLVASTGGQTLFFSGRQLAHIRRRYARLRRELQKAGAHRALKELGDKEHRWVTDTNHKVSRAVVRFALSCGVTKICLEDLTGVQWTKRQMGIQRRDPGRSLHSWAFHQLRRLIEYKATLAGIEVELVNPELTTLTCSRCGHVHKSRPKGRWFKCERCKRVKHIDVNGADNIAQAVSGFAV